MKKVLCVLLAVLLLGMSAMAEHVTYDDIYEALSFEYDDSAFAVVMDDVADGEHLVILSGIQEDWGTCYIRLHVRVLGEDEGYPTVDDFAGIAKGLNTEVTQGEWNGFQNVIMYGAQEVDLQEQVFVVPLAGAGGLLTINIGVEPIEDEAAGMNRDDAISEVLDTLSVTAGYEKMAEYEEADGLHASIQHVVDSPEWLTALPQAQDENVNQLFIVAGMGMDLTTATVSMHQRDEDGAWQQILSTPGYVGKNGLCLDEDHVEGCGQTPVGMYHFNKAFGIAADPGCALDYIRVDDDIYWSGDPEYHYNEMININDYPELAMDDSEHIVDYEYQYQHCLNISFNEDGTPGRGSAIFLHCLGPVKPYTGGCVAIPENIMKLVMQSVREDCVVVIDTVENLGVTF